jgi:hypothetical protein
VVRSRFTKIADRLQIAWSRAPKDWCFAAQLGACHRFSRQKLVKITGWNRERDDCTLVIVRSDVELPPRFSARERQFQLISRTSTAHSKWLFMLINVNDNLPL